MLYEIEQAKIKKNKKLVVVYGVVLLLVLFVSISMGMVAATKVQENESQKLADASNQQNENHDVITLILNNTKAEEQAERKPDERPEQESAQRPEQKPAQQPEQNPMEQPKPNSTNQPQEDPIGSERLKTDEEAFYNQIDDIYNGKPGVKRVFLTFDDGPSDAVTPHILDVLKEQNVKATFFVLGTQVRGHEDLLKREYEEGHYIANHGYSHHYNKIYQSSNAVLTEYNETEEAIKKALENPNYESHLFRFPGGAYDGPYEPIKKEARKLFRKKHIAYLDWNALTYDADGADTKKEILDNLKKTVQGKENVVLLMHDAADKELTYKTLPDVIAYLQKKGYSFKNMYDLMNLEEEYDI